MKKLLSILTMLVLAVVAACGGKTTTTKPVATTTTTTQQTTTTVDLVTPAKEKFLADHANALKLTLETVTIADKEIVAAARSAYAVLDNAVKAVLEEEGQLLMYLAAQIGDLEAAEALAAAKVAAEDALSALDTSSYRAAQVAEIEAIVEAQVALIDACTTAANAACASSTF